MIIFKKALSRRTVLRGMGATVALPLLEAMVPALTPIAKGAAAPVRRLGCVYVGQGANMKAFKPTGEGTTLQLSPILAPLAPFREQVSVLSGLAHKQADSFNDGTGDHARASTVWLTGTHGKRTEGADVRAGVSLDQIIAAQLRQHTPLPSLELALEQTESAIGACDSGYSCVYPNTISWQTPTAPLPMEVHPRAVYERLFGEEATPKEQRKQRHFSRSMLDSVIGEMTKLQRTLGASDRRTVSDYVDTIRQVEQRIQRAETINAQSVEALPERPVDIPEQFEEHAKLMFELALLAYRADITRVMTYMMSRELSPRTYPQIGVPEQHHAVSHHRNDPDNLTKLAQINTLHVALFASFVERLRTTPDGDGSLLDHVILLYGSGISDSNIHNHVDLPTVLVGGGAGRLKGGRHLVYTGDIPMANLGLALLDKMGITGVEKFGDSTGRLDI